VDVDPASVSARDAYVNEILCQGLEKVIIYYTHKVGFLRRLRLALTVVALLRQHRCVSIPNSSGARPKHVTVYETGREAQVRFAVGMRAILTSPAKPGIAVKKRAKPQAGSEK